jgi:ribosomal protein S30
VAVCTVIAPPAAGTDARFASVDHASRFGSCPRVNHTVLPSADHANACGPPRLHGGLSRASSVNGVTARLPATSTVKSCARLPSRQKFQWRIMRSSNAAALEPSVAALFAFCASSPFTPGHTSEVKRIFVPSGDHIGASAPVDSDVTARASDPSAFIT